MSVLRTVIFMVTPCRSARRALTSTSCPPLNTPARRRVWELFVGSTLSDLSQGCIPMKEVTCFTASGEEEAEAVTARVNHSAYVTTALDPFSTHTLPSVLCSVSHNTYHQMDYTGQNMIHTHCRVHQICSHITHTAHHTQRHTLSLHTPSMSFMEEREKVSST